MMAVLKESSGKWEVQCWYRDWCGTRRKKHKRGFSTKADAAKWERQFLLKAEGSPSMTFADFVSLYEVDKKPRLKLNTWLSKKHMIDTKLIPFFGKDRLDSITPTKIIAWQNWLKSEYRTTSGKKLSETYIRTINNQLSAILNHACRYYGLNENPLQKTGKIGKAQPPEMKFWTKNEYLRFSEAIMDKPVSWLAFEVLYWTGVREGELLALTPIDFDVAKLTLRINKSYQRLNKEDVVTSPKTPKSNRTIAIPSFLADEVQDYLHLYSMAASERVFAVTKSFLYHEMERGCEASGVKRIRVHDLRHSHVSLLIDLGFSALAIADRMGHEAVDITYRYAHLFPSVQADMARALDRERGEEVNE